MAAKKARAKKLKTMDAVRVRQKAAAKRVMAKTEKAVAKTKRAADATFLKRLARITQGKFPERPPQPLITDGDADDALPD